MPYNVLVTAISGNVANSILKCFQGLDEVRHLYGCDISHYPCGLNKVEKFYQVVPCCAETQYIKQLLSICEDAKIDVIVPVNEQEISLLNRERNIFQERGIELFLHKPEVYNLFFDKAKTQKLMYELRLPVIPTWYSSDYCGQGTFPLVLKDVFNCGSKHLHIVCSEKELEQHQTRDKTQIVQKYVGNQNSEYTVPVFSGDGGKTIAWLPLRRTLAKEGYTNFIELAKEQYFSAIESICRKIAVYIKLRGSIDLQMREEEGKFYVFECNPRLSGTVNFRRQLGFKDAEWWLQSLGCDFSVQYMCPAKSFVGVRELNEVIIWS